MIDPLEVKGPPLPYHARHVANNVVSRSLDTANDFIGEIGRGGPEIVCLKHRQRANRPAETINHGQTEELGFTTGALPLRRYLCVRS